jgi:hypothetical protein
VELGIPAAGVFWAGVEAGADCFVPGALARSITELPACLELKRERLKAVNMKTIAAPVVSLDKNVAVPLAPKAVCDPPPPKAPAKSAPLPDCSSTIKMSNRQTITCKMVSKIVMKISYEALTLKN